MARTQHIIVPSSLDSSEQDGCRYEEGSSIAHSCKLWQDMKEDQFPKIWVDLTVAADILAFTHSYFTMGNLPFPHFHGQHKVGVCKQGKVRLSKACLGRTTPL
jgi:hypothetical protein